jgi:hypothetical protein
VAFRAKTIVDLEHPKLTQLLRGHRATPTPRRPSGSADAAGV